MMWHAVHAEWLKLWRLRMYRVILLLGMALSLFWVGFVLYLVERDAPQVRQDVMLQLALPGAYLQGFMLAAGFGETFLAIVAASFVANEFSWGTWRLLLPTGVPRWQTLLAKFLVLCAGAAIFVFVTASVPIIAAPIVSAVLQQPVFQTPSAEHWQLELALLPLRSVGALIAPIVLAMTVVVVTRSQAVAVGLTVGLSLSEGIFAAVLQGLGGWWAEVPRVFYLWNAQAIARAPVFSGAPQPGSPPFHEAVPVVLVWTILLGGLTIWWFGRKDIEVRAAS